MEKIEVRTLSMDDTQEQQVLAVESRSEEIEVNGEKRQVTRDWIVGYAARFGVKSLDLGDFVERIDPAAFSLVAERRGRKSPLETRALFNHDPNHVLGRFPDTLRLTVDENGLKYEVLPPESRRDIIELIQRGDIRGSSFSFVVPEDGEEWSMEAGVSVRTVKRIKALYDVGPVTYPAYPDTHVAVAKRNFEVFAKNRSEMERKAEQAKRTHEAIMAKNRDFLRKHGYKIG